MPVIIGDIYTHTHTRMVQVTYICAYYHWRHTHTHMYGTGDIHMCAYYHCRYTHTRTHVYKKPRASWVMLAVKNPLANAGDVKM